MIIGISGKMGSGKDTAGQIIYDYLHPNCEITHFADPLKQFCIDYLGLKYEDLYTEQGKKEFNHFWNMTNREILQKVGTDALRNGFDKDIWVKITELKIKTKIKTNIVIPDVRFDNEAEMILKNKGIVLNIERPETKQDTHISEQGISHNLISINILNDGTLEELKNKVIGALK